VIGIFLFFFIILIIGISPHLIYDFVWIKKMKKERAKNTTFNKCQGFRFSPCCNFKVKCGKKSTISVNGHSWCGESSFILTDGCKLQSTLDNWNNY
jgi:hypothetical protein